MPGPFLAVVVQARAEQVVEVGRAVLEGWDAESGS